ncbi:S8 family serine peptidase [Puniceicoccaceae bacterium K14]|nr:S8 family serine peptidase [Puniceicoccaceae bacterium K14]
MKRILLIGVVLLGTVFLSMVGNRNSSTEIQSLTSVEHEFIDESAKDAAVIPITDEVRPNTVSDVLLNLPVLSFPKSYLSTIESKTVRVSETEVNRITLFESRRSLIRKEETFSLDARAGDWILIKDAYMKGDELTFEYDQSRVSSVEFEEFLKSENLAVSWKSRLSDFVQIKIYNSSLSRFEDISTMAATRFASVIVEPDYINFTSEVPNDFNSARMWHLDQVSAVEAWGVETGSPDVVVAIIDTGAETDHIDLVDNIWVNELEIAGNGIDDDNNGFVDDVNGWDFLDDDNDPNDTDGHGTHVAGIVSATGNNSLGTTGIAWRSKVMILRTGDNDGLSNQAIAEALRYAKAMRERGVNVVATNNSYGGSSSSRGMQSVIQDQEDAGILFVAASGNDGSNLDGGFTQYPASYAVDTIISVANSTQSDSLSSSSNYGTQSVDLAAPGTSIYSTLTGGSIGYLSGTSMASPLVAGTVALVASYDPELSWEDIKNRILDTVDEVDNLQGRVLTGGRLNAFAAVDSEFLNFDIEITSHPGALVIVPNSSYPVEFETLVPEGVGLSVEILEGGQSTASITGSNVTCYFEGEGVYTVRFNAFISDTVRSLDRTVLVGETGDVLDGLLHYYSFEDVGTEVTDSAGGDNGVLTNAIVEEGGLGDSVRLTGSNSFMQFESESSSQITVTALVNADQISHNAHPRIVNTPDYYLYVSSDGGIDTPDGNRDVYKFYSNRIDGDFGVWNTEPKSAIVGEWVHVAATYDSSSLGNFPLIYLNGESQTVRNQIFPTGSQSVSGGTAYIGDRDDGERPWDGLIDEVRLYDRVLSSKELAIVASQYFKDRWNGYGIEQLESEDEKSLVFRFANGLGESPNANYDWSLVDTIGSANFLGDGSDSIVLNTQLLDRAVLQVRVYDDAASESFYYPLELNTEPVQAGTFVSADGSETLLWVEVDESLETGYISIFDEESGYSRFRKEILIDSFGVISATDNVGGTLSGIARGDVSISVNELGIIASAALVEETVDVSSYSGSYSGGVVGVSDSYLDIIVNDLGGYLLARRGRHDEILMGTLDNALLSSALDGGSDYVGSFSDDGSSFSGTITTEGTTYPIFLLKSGYSSSSEFANLSTRGNVKTGEQLLIGGFVIPEGEDRNILVRAVGPSLEAQGVQNVLLNPKVEILSNSAIVNSNTDWHLASSILESVFSSVGAFALQAGSTDSSLEVALSPGAYTALVTSEVIGETGEALVEIYDLDRGEEKALVNVSTRGFVSKSDEYLIGGFVISGTEPKKVLIRGVGPGLMAQNVEGYLPDPKISLIRESKVIASNDDWMGGTSVSNESDASYRAFEIIEEAAQNAGAFDLSEGSKDAAMVLWLDPGAYTVLVSDEGNGEGVALVEIYDLP